MFCKLSKSDQELVRELVREFVGEFVREFGVNSQSLNLFIFIPQTVLALEGFLLSLYRITLGSHFFRNE